MKITLIAFALLTFLSLNFSIFASDQEVMTQVDHAMDKSDFKTAMDLLLPLAKKGNPNARITVGLMYAHGQGVETDYKQAGFWIKKAAQANDARAQSILANMYELGKGFKQDIEKAIYWYKKSADNGQPVRDHIRYLEIYGEPPKPQVVVPWFNEPSS